MGISGAWKNIKGLSSSYNENYYCSAKSTRTLAHMCNTMNSRWWKWWRESHHCCLHFWSVELLQQLLPTGICDFSAYNCASDAKIGVLRNFCHKGSWSHLSLVLQASFNIFFTAEEMSILSHAAQHWPKVINWRFYSPAPNVLGYIVADAKQWQVTKKFIFQGVKTACNSNEEDDKKALCFFNEANVPCIHNCFVFSKKHEVSP